MDLQKDRDFFEMDLDNSIIDARFKPFGSVITDMFTTTNKQLDEENQSFPLNMGYKY